MREGSCKDQADHVYLHTHTHTHTHTYTCLIRIHAVGAYEEQKVAGWFNVIAYIHTHTHIYIHTYIHTHALYAYIQWAHTKSRRWRERLCLAK